MQRETALTRRKPAQKISFQSVTGTRGLGRRSGIGDLGEWSDVVWGKRKVGEEKCVDMRALSCRGQVLSDGDRSIDGRLARGGKKRTHLYAP
jgi:hypothetical protein